MKRIEPGQPVLVRHVGSGVFGIKERRGVLLNIVTVRDEAGSSTVLNVAVGHLQDSGPAGWKAAIPEHLRLDPQGRQLAGIPEWRLEPFKEDAT